MAMAIGSVTINPDGTWSGTGMTKALVDTLQPYFLSKVPPAPPPYDTDHNGPPRTAAMLVGIGNEAKDLATAIATALVPYIVAEEQAIVPPNAFGSSIPIFQTLLAVE